MAKNMRESVERIAVVTGANRGIGLEVVRQLAQLGILVVLTSRNKAKGMKACQDLQREELPVRYHPLDVDHAESIYVLCRFMEQEFGRCDILVNNAGIFPDSENASEEKFPSIFDANLETIRRAQTTNVYGSILLIQGLVPFMKKNNYGRIVNVSSGMGQLTEMNGGYPAYRISKTAINAVTRIVSEELLEYNILVNSVCPGWVKTEMGGPDATRSVEEGAETIVWLATLPNDGHRGKFFRDKKVIAW